MHSWGTLLSLALAYGSTLLLIRWVVLTRKRQPVASVAWILAIILLPIVGGVLFLFFGINQVQRRKEQMLRVQLTADQRLPDLHFDTEAAVGRMNDTQLQLMRLATESCGTRPTADNQIELLTDTNVAMR
ncbi:MAG: PLDc N-terminal domain-containing protein, partial [Planctomycetaceae bacterium]|nr:PLDc N-terminal domain-containing protein [Planctomycetaceae bacterium]